MAEKETEAKSAQGAQRRSHTLRQEFWTLALEALRYAGLTRYETVSPSRDNWIPCGTGISGIIYTAAFSKTAARVEVAFVTSDQEKNKAMFDEMLARRDEIEAAFGHHLDWQRMDSKKMSRICFEAPFDGYNREVWPEMATWMATHMSKLQMTFNGPIAELRGSRRPGGKAS